MEQALSSAVQQLNLNSDSIDSRNNDKEPNFRRNGTSNSRRQRKGNDSRNCTKSQDDERDFIPTAIVIKNIPFSIKRELFLDIFGHLGLPTPFALNYHLDNGTFRGLAFANFHTPEETAIVVNSIKGIEICGRKLRVEYKKYNGSEKREETPSNPPPAPQKVDPSIEPISVPHDDEFDFNDLQTCVFYEQIASFYEDHSRAALIYPPSLDNVQRKLIHALSERFGLYHYSEGTGEERHIRVSKTKPQPSNSPRKGASRRSGQNYPERLYDQEATRPSNAPKPFKKMPKPSDSLAVYPVRQPRIPDLKNNFAARKKVNSVEV